jgi:hypothetical protein
MPNQRLITATVKITAKDINGNNVAKQFNTVYAINIDYNDATINIVDATGSFYFALTPVTSFTYTITGVGVAAVSTLVIS